MSAGSRTVGILEQEWADLRAQLLRHARHAVHDAWLAEDLVQETLIVVMQKDHTRRGDSTLLTWAVGILRHKVADWYRSPSRQRMVQLDTDDEQLEPAGQELHDSNGAYVDQVRAWQQPENREEIRQMMVVLLRCLDCLPKRTGRVFMMREWLGFETSEICQRAAISAENCRTILHRARTALRVCMQRDWIIAKAKP